MGGFGCSGMEVCSIFYCAANDTTSRTRVWQTLREVASDVPWLIMGDFNEVISSKEKVVEGALNLHSSGLKECCIELDLVDIKSVGLFYTWTNDQIRLALTGSCASWIGLW